MTNKSVKREGRNLIVLSEVLFIIFLLYIYLIKTVDVQAIGPQDSEVGLATINGFVRDLIGTNQMCYQITEILGKAVLVLVPIFALVGLIQLIMRKSLKKVDTDIILLGLFFVVVVGFYVLFEFCIINYRPVILEKELEASFPSSHTMLAICILGSAMYQFTVKIKIGILRNLFKFLAGILMAVIVCGRFISGVHWATDIVGGIILSASLLLGYIGCCKFCTKQKDNF